MATQQQAAVHAAASIPTTTVRPAIPQRRIRLSWAVGLAALTALGWQISTGKYYAAGSDFGYYLGLVGGVLMLVLLLYPLRKHARFMDKIGATRHWFRLHMIIGVLAPTLILFHSTFQFGSLNATVATLCMLLVASSGLVGRFIYRKIHHGLYGRAATLQEIQAKLGISDGDVKSRFHFAPDMLGLLLRFESNVLARDSAWYQRLWRFVTVGIHARLMAYRAGRELELAARVYGLRRGWDEMKLRRRLRQGRAAIRSHLSAVIDVARFRSYERLFSLWHILHVPFIFLLVISGVVHVVAVHMY